MLDQIIHFLTTGPGTVSHAVSAVLPLIALLAGAAAGKIKNDQEQQEANRQRKYESERERWSPWTGVHGAYVKNPSEMGNIVQGAGAGLSFGTANPGMFGGGSAASAAPAATGMDESINYSGVKGIGPMSNGQAYANSLQGSYGPYRNGSIYANFLKNNRG